MDGWMELRLKDQALGPLRPFSAMTHDMVANEFRQYSVYCHMRVHKVQYPAYISGSRKELWYQF